ncbi:MAG TPA: ABC transporter permease [Pyrinomonadaceae bacterium]|jgi:putative ABC transport system permease protein|nr:ABC transporter permease [Pyrinomonadaceae bacterium]
METLWQDLSFGLRMLLRKPAFTAMTILALALGIGANTAVFSVVNAILLRPLPYKDSDSLVLLREKSRQLPEASVSFPNFLDWKERNQVFEQMAIFRDQSYNLTGPDESERISASEVSAGLFPVLGVEPILGRAFLPEDDKPGANPVAIISHGLWQRRFGADRGLVERALTLDGKSFIVVGVMPPGFDFPQKIDLWIPVGLSADKIMKRESHPGFTAIARLRPGIGLERARTDMQLIARQLGEQYPATNKEADVLVFSLYERTFQDIRPTLLILLGAAGFVLLIACANMANLMLAQAAARHKEIAIRLALGATRLRLIRQLLTESMLLAVAGGVLGLMLVFWSIDLIVAALPENIPRMKEVSVDGRVLSFTLLVSLLTGIVFGLAPAIRASRPNLNESLKEGGGRAGGDFRRHRVHRFLVVSEMALALMLLIGAGLMIGSFLSLQKVDPGLNPRDVLTMQVSLPQPKYSEGRLQTAFFRQVLERIETLPGVEATGLVTPLPLGGEGFSLSFTVEGQPAASPGDQPSADCAMINPHYFRSMGIPILKGRPFTDRDEKEAPGVVIIDETLAAQFWPNEDPLGKRLKLGGPDSKSPWLSIVGVGGHVKNNGLDAPSRMELYLPYSQKPYFYMTLLVRTTSDHNSMAAGMRNAVRAVDQDQSVYNVRSMENILADSIAPRRVSMFLLTIFAAVALILAAIGIYGVMSYSVAQRTREIGIRMALGAQRADVLKLVLRQGMVPALLGILIGLAAAFVLTRLMSSLLYGVSATDPAIFAATTMLLASVALVACYIPARRATKVDPMVALRHE